VNQVRRRGSAKEVKNAVGARSTVRAVAGHKTSGEPVYEELLVDVQGNGLLQMVVTPGLVLGVAAGDVISVSDTGVVTVLERGRNLAVHMYAEHHLAEGLTTGVDALGGRVDSRAPRLTVFTVPVDAGFPRIENLLNAFVEAHPEAEWYYGNVYAEDGITPLEWWK